MRAQIKAVPVGIREEVKDREILIYRKLNQECINKHFVVMGQHVMMERGF